MKTVYFVRHGESEDNAAKRYNAFDTHLSQKGERQAIGITKRCSYLPVEIIISSDMERARQTAHVIAEHVPHTITESALFRERITAARLLGKSHDDPEAIKIVEESRKNFHVPGWRHEGGENFEDLKARALQGLAYLTGRTEDSILVVTHGFFMRVIVSAVLFGKELTSHECLDVIDGLGELENTGLTVIHSKEGKKLRGRSPWRLAVWNDHAHLG
ncbi:MAG: histidine phosphatase family protein [bacterium]|nr:histidine phosphatase family protein [bacterium]